MSAVRMLSCAVCGLRPRVGLVFCAPCGRAFDRWRRTRDGTEAELIEWVAYRARRFARKGKP